MNTSVAKPGRVAIIGASGTYGKRILDRAEEIGVETVVVTRSPHKFSGVRPTTRVVETQLDEKENLKEAFTGCDGVISALGDDRKKRPKTHCLPPTTTATSACTAWHRASGTSLRRMSAQGRSPRFGSAEKRGQPPPNNCLLFGAKRSRRYQ